MDPFVLVKNCYNCLPHELKARPWEVTEHGRKVLRSEDELNAYIAAYGEMHIVKCRAALQSFPFNDLASYSYEIFDWGCGQGLATLTLLDMIQERNLSYRLERIYLIEPSACALSRAENWVRRYAGPGVDVVSVNKYIPNDDNALMPEVYGSTRISINLFSNILDIRSLSLAWLAKKTSSLASVNYIVCIGPRFIQNTNTRLNDFCGYFNPKEYYSKIDSFPYAYTSRTHHAYGCEARSFVHNSSNPLIDGYIETANDVVDLDPYDYASEVLCYTVDCETINLYNTLRKACVSSFDIFFRPNINCDIADFVLTSISRGFILINVCNDISKLDEDFNRIDGIKKYLFNIHLKTIKIDSLICPSVFNCVKTALYFPNNTLEEVEDKIKQLNEYQNFQNSKNNEQYQNKDFYKFLYRFTKTTDFRTELNKVYSNGFKYEYYEELINIISAQWHSYKDGNLNFKLNKEQLAFVRNESKRLRVKGVAGCGKTQIVANRAVEQHIKTGERVLIITFNISLIQYVRMRISQIPADFSPNMFEVINYHQFFKSKANQYAKKEIQLSDYDNPYFFDQYREEIKKYKSIIIDEVQDFKEAWIQSIIRNFLDDGGSVSLFGDGEQNIYCRYLESESKMPPVRECGFSGPWGKMNKRISMRIQNPRISSLSSDFIRRFISKDISPIDIQEDNMFEEFYIKYFNKNNELEPIALADNIINIIDEYKIIPKDIAVLGKTIKLLRDIEAEYVSKTGLKTMVNFETATQYDEIKKKSESYYFEKNLKEIRRTAKTHFTTNCDEIKFSTIHSFKGWESKTIILFLQDDAEAEKHDNDYSIAERENYPALIYTALTRARCNLFVINLGNKKYDIFFKEKMN